MGSISITDTGLAHLSGMTHLRKLDLSDSTAITDAGLTHLSGLTRLRKLDLSGATEITDAGLARLSGLTRLRKLDLSGATGITDAGLAHLSGLTRLRKLDLSGATGITDAGLAHLSGLTHLRELDLSGAKRITDAGLAHLSGLKDLYCLKLNRTKITDAGLAHLSGLKELWYLELNKKEIIAGAPTFPDSHLQGGNREESKPSCDRVEDLLKVDALELEIGCGVVPLVDTQQSGDGGLLARVQMIRQQLALEMGIVVPPLHVRDNLQLKAGAYSILVKGNEVAHGELMIDYLLAMNPGDAKKTIDGIETREPAFNLPALWIPASRREEAQFAGYSVVDISTVIATHLIEVIRSHCEELLGRQEVQRLIDNLAKTAPKPVEEMMRGMSLGAIQKVLQHLLKERVSIRDLLTITETLADYGPMVKDTELLTEYCRQKLARSILKSIMGSNNRDLYVLTVDPQVEDIITGGLQQTEQGVYLSLEPDKVQAILNGISALLEKFAPLAQPPVILCSPVVRRHLRKIIERFVPTLAVL
ncbi:MAG: FHIPEP family type III secretion protein, partial [Desulfovibrionaceae bacterium]|nr:FHIPEP family type III secretion protein [Desulfovibrionaceae bacterium]